MANESERAIAAAVWETLKRECVDTEGDWRLGPVDVIFDDAKAIKIILPAVKDA